jgi:hypothetical protein
VNIVPALLLLLAVVVFGLVGGAILSGAWRPKVVDRVMPTPKITKEMAALVGLIRAKDETASAFDKRVLAAHREVSDASTEFMNAAHQIGSFDAGETNRPGVRIVAIDICSERVVVYRLPPDHPAAMRYAKAKRGDGQRSTSGAGSESAPKLGSKGDF